MALATAGPEFKPNYLLQDAAVLNIIRACEAVIDWANLIIRKKRLGIPAESSESFGILVREDILERELGDKLQKWWAFAPFHGERVPAVVEAENTGLRRHKIKGNAGHQG